MPKKSRSHLVTVRISFNRACSRQVAVRQAREELQGQDFYTNDRCEGEPDKMIVRGFRLAAPKGSR